MHMISISINKRNFKKKMLRLLLEAGFEEGDHTYDHKVFVRERDKGPAIETLESKLGSHSVLEWEQ